MNVHPSLYILSLIVTASCNFKEPKKDNKHDIFTDTLVYTYKTIKERAADCSSKPDSTCNIVNIKYPVFSGQTLLNDSLAAKILKAFAVHNRPDTSLTQLGKHFFDAYNKQAEEDKRVMPYQLNITAKVISQDSGFLAVQVGGYTYQGGAHGRSSISFINWNPKIKKEVVLKDIFIDGYQEKLRLAAENIFRKEEKLTDTASLTHDYFFKNGKFGLNDNYSFNPFGIRFIYNECEIKPYAAGQTELVIPYVQIKSLMKPNTVIAQYIK